MKDLPLRDDQSDHYPNGDQCKCGWKPTGDERLVEHIYEAQMQEIDLEWANY